MADYYGVMLSMPTTVASQTNLDIVRCLIEEHIERTGETVTAIADQAAVDRKLVSRIRAGNYPSSPSLDVVSRLAAAVGGEVLIQRIGTRG